jgi:tetratricopeptide (TPR) repeat protein/TolB-like protein
MDTSRRDHVRKLLAEAQSVPPEERDAFLRERCDDPALRAEVASLLAAQEDASGFYQALADSVVAPMLRGLDEAEADAPHADDSDPLGLEGTVVGRYAVEEHLGGGGMGIVYRARDTDLGRTVALKFLPPHLAGTEEAEERFAREARAAAALEHSNVGTIHEIGRTGEGHRYIVMTYYEGETLKERINREGPLPIEEALGYAAQIAEALARAHAAGIVHRDVKPANVMITERGEVKLVDFGLARLAESPRLTASGQQLGTVGYMSPEQVEGREVGPATDLWALGVVLYEMLTGERPFQGKRRAAVLHAVVHEAPTPVRDYRPEVSPELARVVERCLQKAPEDRYKSAALTEDLQALRAGKSPATEGPPLSQASDGIFSQSRWIVGAAVVLLVAGFAALVWAVWPGGEVPTDSGRSVAVLPFEVSGAGAQEWRDGMVTALSLNLDGAAGLRAIPDRRIFAATEQVDSSQAGAGRSPALEVAQAVGATYAVVGSAVQLGQELRLSADVRRVGSGERLGQVEVEGLPGSVTTLTDQLTRKVLGVLLDRSEEAIPSVNLASITTSSLEALRSFLEGERHFRAEEYEAAFQDYETATDQDSTFALAHARRGLAASWIVKAGERDRAYRKAHELSGRLPLRERRLIWAQYARRVQDRVLTVTDSLRRWTKIYPDDPQVWYVLGETIFHGFVPGGWPEAERAFREATRLDPGVAPYHYHLMDIAMSLHHDSAMAARRIDAHPEGPVKKIYETFWDLNFGSPGRRQKAWTRLDTLPVPDVGNFGWLRLPLLHPTDRALQAGVIRRVAEREGIDRPRYNLELFFNYFGRGQMRAAASLFSKVPKVWASVCGSPFHLSLGYPVPDSLLRANLEPSQVQPGVLRCVPFYLVEKGRFEEFDSVLGRLRDRMEQEGASERAIETTMNELRGYRAWKTGDLKQAEKLWSGLKWSRSHMFGALWRGDLYRELGQRQTAEDWYLAAWQHPVAHERLGQLYEKMGRPEKAAAAYERFVAGWKKADPELQDRVAKARRRVEALREKRTSE